MLKILLLGALMFIPGCTMFSAWRSIPPPGGCDQCHTVAISNNWNVKYQAAMLSDERDREYFQTAEYTMQQRAEKPESALELRKVEESQCFACHRSPNAAHTGRKGRFHH